LAWGEGKLPAGSWTPSPAARQQPSKGGGDTHHGGERGGEAPPYRQQAVKTIEKNTKIKNNKRWNKKRTLNHCRPNKKRILFLISKDFFFKF
jgi:hypothetical protein